MKLGGINVIPDRRDVPWLTDPANPTMLMGTPYCIPDDYSHPSRLIRGRYVSSSPRVTTWTWGLSLTYFSRGEYQQHRNQVRFNDGGARLSARVYRGPGKHVHRMCFVTHRPTSYANRVECQHVFEQFREAMMGKLPKRILFYRGQ